MDFGALLTAIIPLITSLANARPAQPSTPGSPVVLPDQAIKDLQAFLNLALSLNPPLRVDGWLGPKTDAAIEQGLTMLRSMMGTAR